MASLERRRVFPERVIQAECPLPGECPEARSRLVSVRAADLGWGAESALFHPAAPCQARVRAQA